MSWHNQQQLQYPYLQHNLISPVAATKIVYIIWTKTCHLPQNISSSTNNCHKYGKSVFSIMHRIWFFMWNYMSYTSWWWWGIWQKPAANVICFADVWEQTNSLSICCKYLNNHFHKNCKWTVEKLKLLLLLCSYLWTSSHMRQDAMSLEDKVETAHYPYNMPIITVLGLAPQISCITPDFGVKYNHSIIRNKEWKW